LNKEGKAHGAKAKAFAKFLCQNIPKTFMNSSSKCEQSSLSFMDKVKLNTPELLEKELQQISLSFSVKFVKK
jgi:hypothetical protein